MVRNCRYDRSGARQSLIRGLGLGLLALTIWGATSFPISLAPSAERTLYFKLPIEGARFHWRFLDTDAFLSGELTLRILNTDRDETLVVFRDGKLHDGWEILGDAQPGDGYYFGFSTTDRVRTHADDSLVITLTAAKDLRGRGPYREGVLAAGVWQMTGTYSSIYGKRWNVLDLAVLHGNPPIAYMECWTDVWPITLTRAEGWKGAKPEDDGGFFLRVNAPRGTNGNSCGSHI